MGVERPIARVLGKLTVTKREGQWHRCLCPSHDDRASSLSVAEGDGGVVVFRCFAGCSKEQVLAALELTWADLWPGERRVRKPRTLKDSRGRELRPVGPPYDYVDDRGVKRAWNQRYEPKDFRQGMYTANGEVVWGMSAGWYRKGGDGCWYSVKGVDGRRLSKRTEPPPDDVGAVWLEGVKALLYRLPTVRRAVELGVPVWVVDGEKDVHALERHGAVATTRIKKQGKWCRAWTEMLGGGSALEDGYEVVVVRDRDGEGKRFEGERTAALIAESLRGAGVPVRVVEAREGKDASDHLEAGYTLEDFVPVDDWRDFDAPSSDSQPTDVAPAGPAGPQVGTKGGAGGLDDFPLTDLGNAERLVAWHRGDVRYCPKLLAWVVWDGLRWRIDDEGGAPMLQRCAEMVRRMQAMAGEADMPDSERGKLVRVLRSFESRNRLENMETLARRLPGVPVQPDVFDQAAHLLTVANGVLDLSTGEMREARRDDLCTNMVDLAFDPEARCPVWSAFVDRCVYGDPEMKRFLAKAAGYSLTGSTREQVFFFLYGDGQTGKSKFVDGLELVLGPYAQMLMPKKLATRRFEEEIPTHFAKLRGARFVKVPEWDDSMTLDESMIKILTGESKTSARFMRENEFTFHVTFKFWMYGNSTPNIRGTDKGIRRRPLMIEFSNIVPEEERDLDLMEKFKAEAAGILAWCVRGARLWYAEGLQAPSSVRALTEEYFLEMDQVARFLEECCVLEDAETRASALYNAYAEWAKRAHERYTLSTVIFSKRIMEKGLRRVKLTAGHFYQGVRVRPEFEAQGVLE